MKGFFVGAFDNVDMQDFRGSAAGAKVQTEIIEALSDHLEALTALIMPERPSWPKSRLLIKSSMLGAVKFLPIINLALIKKPWFFGILLFYFFRERPRILFQYNSSISGAIFSLVIRFFSCKSLLILQDLNAPISFSWRLFSSPKNIIGYIYTKLIPLCFDYYIPITNSYVKNLKLPEVRCIVFQGGVLKSSIRAANRSYIPKPENNAVFAGALEEYNGIDLLVKKWPMPEELDFQLNIFGRGSLNSYIESFSGINHNIVFHGFKSPAVVDDYIARSDVNFCLRYSKGIKQEHFFPSKFFDLILFEGTLVCNKFENIPSDLELYLTFVDDDLEDLVNFLKCKLQSHSALLPSKNKFLEENYTWSGFFSKFFSKFRL
jgi:hypothetical protein